LQKLRKIPVSKSANDVLTLERAGLTRARRLKAEMEVARAIVFFGLATSAFASATLDVLVNAAASFSATIQQQLKML
jgi:hypothetical protein